MRYLDSNALNSLDPALFQRQTPYPWANPAGLVTEDGCLRLRENLPDMSLFKDSFGRQRKHGQNSHDRFTLKYQDGIQIPQAWQDFINELRSEQYAKFVREHFRVRKFNLSFFWFFTPAGCSVSPHCDHYSKIGAHILYLNSATDWQPEWGGETLILGSNKKIRRASAPDFSDFSTAIPAVTTETHSLLFKRTSKSWHGVREITCPDGFLRKVFMVSIQHTNIYSRFINALAA